MSRFLTMAFLWAALGDLALALTIPVTIDVPAPPIVNVGESFQITILVSLDPEEVPTGLATAGVRLYGADPWLVVTGIIPGPEFSPLTGINDLDLTPPDPGLFEMVPILGPGAYGPVLAIFEVTAVAPGTANLSLGFWDDTPLFENFTAWWDEEPPDPEFLDDYVVFGTARLVIQGQSSEEIPEPSALTLLLIGGAAWRSRRRIHRPLPASRLSSPAISRPL